MTNLQQRILALTFGKVVRREGISALGEATVKEFMGSKDMEKRGHGVRVVGGFNGGHKTGTRP